MKNNYIFVRHGQTYWNANGIMHGQYDIPLNENGIRQAKKVANQLKNTKIDVCFSSPLSRAENTAKKILWHHRNIPLIFDDRLKELSKGKLEGKHFNSEKLLASENNEFLKKYSIESKQSFFLRVKTFLDEIESKYNNNTILIVAHSGTIKMCYFSFKYPNIPLHKAYYALHVKNCKPYTIDDFSIEDKKMKIGFFPMVADILHSGHILAIEEAKKKCDYLIVGLHCKPTYKNPQQSIYERYMQLRAVKWVDEIIPYENIDRDADLFTSLEYDIYFLGSDHKDMDWELKEIIQNHGKEISYLNRNHGYSSTKIKQKAKEHASK